MAYKTSQTKQEQEKAQSRHYSNTQKMRERAFQQQLAQEKAQYKEQLTLLSHYIKMGKMEKDAELSFLLSLQNRYGHLSVEESRALAERIHSLQEEARKKAYEQDRAHYEHKKALDQMSVREQLAALQALKNAHALSQKEKWALEEEMYALQKSERENQAQDAIALFEKVQKALKNQLTTQKEQALSAYAEQLDALEQVEKATDFALVQQKYDERKKELEYLFTIEKSQRKQKEIYEQLKDVRREETLWHEEEQRQQERENIKASMEHISKEYDALMQTERLRFSALQACIKGDGEALESLLNAYAPFEGVDKNTLLQALQGTGGQEILNVLHSVQTTHQMAQVSGAQKAQTPVTVYANDWIIHEASDVEGIFSKLEQTVRSALRM